MKLTPLAVILALATPLHAGGPVLVEEDYTEAEPQRGVNPLVIIGGLVVACLILCGGDDDPAPVTPEPQPDPGPKPCVYEGGGC